MTAKTSDEEESNRLIIINNILPSKTKTLDDILFELKPFGWYQLFNHVFQVYVGIIAAGVIIGSFYSLGGLKPEYTCWDIDQPLWNNTCHMMRNCTNLTVVTEFHSIYEDFEWACESDYLMAGFTTLIMVAQVVSYVIAGVISDSCGRRPLLYVSVVLTPFAMAAQAYSPTSQMYLISTLFLTLFSVMNISASYPIVQETVCIKYRMLQGFSFQWIVGCPITAYIAYLTGDWRSYLKVLSLMVVPVAITMFFLCESPRWLLQRGRISETRKALNFIARWNRVKIRYTDEQVARIDIGMNLEKRRIEHPCRVFGSSKLLFYAIPLSAIGLLYRCVYQIVIMETIKSGNPFINVAMLGILRIWAPPFILALEANVVSCGRKTIIVTIEVLVAACMSLMIIQRMYSIMYLDTFALLASYCLTSGVLWTCYKILISEIFPTEIRANAMSMYSVISCAGSIIGAQLVFGAQFWPPLPYVVTTVLSIFGVVTCALILPETKNQPLKDHIEQLKSN